MPPRSYEHPLKAEIRLYGAVLTAGLALCWAAALYGGPTWMFEVGGNFVMPVAICGGLLAAALAWARGWTWMGVALATTLWSASTSLTWSTGQRAGEPALALLPGGPDRLTVLVSNVLSSNPTREVVEAQVREAHPDVVVLLETTPNWAPLLEGLSDVLPYAVSQPRGDNFGMTLLSEHPINVARVLDLGGFGGAELPIIVAEVRTPLGPVTFVAVHVYPPVSAEAWALRQQHLLRAAELVRGLEGPVVVMGDLNTAMSTRSYRLLAAASGLQNARAGRGWLGTWPSGAPEVLRLPLDHVLHNEEVLIHDLSVLPANGSDHRGLVAELSVVR